MDERRRYPREGCLITAHVRMGKRIFEGTIIDICEDGCFVASTAPFDEDSPLQIRFRHPRTNQIVKARTVVARRVNPKDGRIGLGLKLIDTLEMLGQSTGLTASSSGAWSRPELATQSGTWSTYAQDRRAQAEKKGRGELWSPEAGDRRGLHTEDTDRTEAGRIRTRLQVAGTHPTMALLLDVSESGFCTTTTPCPPIGKLLKIEFTHQEAAISVTAKAIWRSNDGGPRRFGATILKFGGHDDREGWHAMLATLRHRRIV